MTLPLRPIAYSQVPTAARHLAVVDMVRAEEKLAVEVGLVDRVQIHHLDVLKTGLHQVLQQLASCTRHPEKRTKVHTSEDKSDPHLIHLTDQIPLSPTHRTDQIDQIHPHFTH